jgi:RNA-directed DNA polymerase
MDKLKSQGKPFDIPKREVWEAFRQVKENQGAPGVDGQSIEAFEADLKNNLYKIWNRMSSGTYFPPPVRAVEIAVKQHGGGTRMLGIPCVSDRVAQTVVARHLGVRVEPVFCDDSFGYRPGRSALDAVERCRERCWRKDWVIDLDVARFFDTAGTSSSRPPSATPTPDGSCCLSGGGSRRRCSCPTGPLPSETGGPRKAVSPALANLFMHYAFDTWLEREFPT